MSDSYIVLAHYYEKRRGDVVLGHGDVVLGHFQTYEESLKCLGDLQEYKNALGECVFSGGSVYTVPEKPYPKDYFLLAGVSAGVSSNYNPIKPKRR